MVLADLRHDEEGLEDEVCVLEDLEGHAELLPPVPVHLARRWVLVPQALTPTTTTSTQARVRILVVSLEAYTT